MENVKQVSGTVAAFAFCFGISVADSESSKRFFSYLFWTSVFVFVVSWVSTL